MRAGDVVCVHSHSRRRRGGVIVSRGGVGGNGVSCGGRRQGRMTNAQRERLRYYKIIISYQPVCPPRSSTTCLYVTPLWPLAVWLFPPFQPVANGPSALQRTACDRARRFKRRHSTCSRVACRMHPIVTVYRVSEMCVVKIYYCA